MSKRIKANDGTIFKNFLHKKPTSAQIGKIFLFIFEFFCYMNLPDSFLENRMFKYFLYYFCQVAHILRGDYISNYYLKIYNEALKYRDRMIEESLYLNLMIDSNTDKGGVTKIGVIAVNNIKERIVLPWTAM